MFNPEKFVSKPEGKESLEDLKKLTLFVVRHGRTKYLERKHVEQTGKWAPDTQDLVEGEEERIKETAETIIRDLDPQKHILVFLSSPRARALRTKENIEKVTKVHGFETYEGHSPVVEMLRSGGDESPLVGYENEQLFIEEPPEDYSIHGEGEEPTDGKRMKRFLSFFAAVDKKKLIKSIKDEKGGFHGKIPVFISVTHGEVTYAGILPHNTYKKSLIGSAFPEAPRYPRVMIPRARHVKLDFDLDHPGDIELTASKYVSPTKAEETRRLKFDQNDGTIKAIGYEELKRPAPQSLKEELERDYDDNAKWNLSG